MSRVGGFDVLELGSGYALPLASRDYYYQYYQSTLSLTDYLGWIGHVKIVIMYWPTPMRNVVTSYLFFFVLDEFVTPYPVIVFWTLQLLLLFVVLLILSLFHNCIQMKQVLSIRVPYIYFKSTFLVGYVLFFCVYYNFSKQFQMFSSCQLSD